MKKIFIISIFILFLFIGCKDDEYEVSFKENDLKVSVKDSNLVVKNDSDYPIIFDEITKGDKSIASFIEYKDGSYVKYQDEVILNIKDSNNQYIMINLILLPKKERLIPLKIEKQDELEIIAYPVNFQFIADNIYFKANDYSDMEARYKLYSKDEIKSFKLPFLDKKKLEEINEINGIMIYVSEYDSLDDYVQKISFKYE